MSKRLTTNKCIEGFICKHRWLYNYRNIEYINAHTKVKIICRIHGSFWQTPHKHKLGDGCPYCAGNIKKSTETFIQDVYCKHGDRYNYKLVDYINRNTKVKIICPIHGVFKQTPSNHLNGNGCPYCKGKFNRKYFKNGFPLYDTYHPQLQPYGVECRRSQQDGNILEVRCYLNNCDTWFIPSLSDITHKIQALKDNYKGLCNLYCSDECKHNCVSFNKSSKQLEKQDKINTGLIEETIKRDGYTQSQFRQILLDEYGDVCERCGKECLKVDVHHIIPIAMCENILTWDKDNGMVVCKKCHHKHIHKGECSGVKLGDRHDS